MSADTSGAAEPPIRWGADGLVPAVAQDEATGTVLMVGFVNAEALAASRATGLAHYWSRSRGKLWRKGETSGNEQELVSIAVNCERNSLLLTVRQRGAVCHDGYPTCYYRRLEPDDSLSVIQARAFDPESVYKPTAAAAAAPTAAPTAVPTPAAAPAPAPASTSLTETTRAQWAAYAVLRDLDLEAVSATSRRLRGDSDAASARVADELQELAGVLDSSHGHGEPEADTLLEASQVLYWLTLAALWHGLAWEEMRPDAALARADPSLSRSVASERLLTFAGEWQEGEGELLERIRETMAATADACLAMGVEPAAVVARDLADLRQKPYLADAFAEPAAVGTDP